MSNTLFTRNADRVAAAEAARLSISIPTYTIADRVLTLSTGECFDWVQGSGWVRPDGTRADGRS